MPSATGALAVATRPPSWSAPTPLERLSNAAHKLAAQGAFTPTPRLARLAGGGEAELETVLGALGFRAKRDSSGFELCPPRRARDREARIA